MNLSAYLNPVNATLLSSLDNPNLLGHNLLIHAEDQLPDYYNAQVCIVGLPDQDHQAYDTTDQSGLGAALVNKSFFNDEDKQEETINTTVYGADKIRETLYRIYKGQGNLIVADLGNLKPGPTPDQTATRITQVCEMIHQAGAQVILIGPSQVATIQQLDGLKHHLQKLDTPKPLSLTVLDSKLDMDYNPHGNQDHNFLNNIFLNPEPILYDFALIGHQNYLSDAGQLAFLDQSSFVSRRLGQHRDNPQQSEPYLRQADCLSIDLACINGLEMPAVSNPEPLGFKGEEWCQLCWYAGNSPKLKTIGIYGYQTYKDPNLLAAKLIAIGLWHLLEGMSQVDGNQQITEYHIASPGLDELVFACQPDQRYWLTLTKNHIKSLDDQVLLFGCQKNDYQEVINGEVPQTLVRVMNRLSIYEKQAKKAPKSHGKTKRNKASS